MKKIMLVFLLSLLIYTRFVGLDWGLPYPLHPDERNMAVALQQLQCDTFSIKNCFNPHFFAYGQFSLYLGYILIQIVHLVTQKLFIPITFYEAVMSLRVISAVASILTVLFLIRIVRLLYKELSFLYLIFYILFFTFQPYFIQFSHFGTTESLLIFFYALIMYYSLQLFSAFKWRTIVFLSLFSGLTIATKISSFVFIVFPFLIMLIHKDTVKKKLFVLFSMTMGAVFFTLFFSPHNFISFSDFVNSMRYESAVALGIVKVFYTRQFEGIVPIWFQLSRVFPYVFGWTQYIVGILGFFFLSWRKKEINLLRFAFLIYFIPNSFLYTQWTRFLAPIFPIFSLFAVLFFFQLHEKMKKLKQVVVYVLIGLSIIPGIAYLSVYQNPDVRFTASDWIYKNIPEGSYILSETANVVDIPIESQKSKIKSKKYQYISFNFYELDNELTLQTELEKHLAQVDYIVIPSRRVFKNHPRSKYPLLNDYYQKLFSGELGFQKIAEFTSYPKFSLFGRTLIEFPDENAEETWSVFDHPVIRIYQKI